MPRTPQEPISRVNIRFPAPLCEHKTVELPHKVLLVADLGGDAERPKFAERRAIQVTDRSFSEVMATSVRPRLRFSVSDHTTSEGGRRLDLDLRFESLDDFAPDALIRRIAPLRELAELRGALRGLRHKFIAGRSGLAEALRALLKDPEALAELRGHYGLPPAREEV